MENDPLKELRNLESEVEDRFERELQRKNDDEAYLGQNYPETPSFCDECKQLRRNVELKTVTLEHETGLLETKRVCCSCCYWYQKTNQPMGE